MHFNRKKLTAFLIVHILIFSFIPFPVRATFEQNQEAAEARKLLPIESNLIENWPAGPAIGAAGAILYEANTGVILYEKNIHEIQYPASTTKIMTCLLAVDHANLNDMIPFSYNAVHSIGRGTSNIGIDAGESLTFEQALYGAMVASANEVCNGIAEYVGGDMETFAQMMTEKAHELGCQNTNFTNAHGLFDEDHYTTAYDLALIAAAYFKHEMLAKIGNTVSYHFTPTDTQPDDFVVRNKHRLINGEIQTNYNILGGKTGYTNASRQTLVTAAEKDGMRLICVILKEETPEQFNDTVKLFDYGFSNFQIVNVADHEKRYTIENASFFRTGNDIFGDSSPLLSLNRDDYLVMPRTTDFSSLDADITYNNERSSAIAEIIYSYNGAYLGTATIDFASENRSTYDFDHQMPFEVAEEPIQDEENIIFINVKQVIFIIIIVASLAILFFIFRSAMKRYHFTRRRKRRRRKPVRKSKRDRFKGYYL
ncbi:MAG: D-alanyl-D-alanine carboxypeptidase [Lachnospiraceae bacterium]|nr:D-alanyl-D-alanine carboxypeptidase [Lachnospiraceae bacterium]